MKKNIVLLMMLTGFAIFSITSNPHQITKKYAAVINSGGAPSGKTGAPGEGNCASCHSGNVNDGSATSSITFNGNNNQYDVGITYDFSLSISNGSSKNGFQLVILDSLQNNDVGTLIASDLVNTQINANNRTYLNHTSSGNTQNSWNFQWTAPSSDVGPVTIYYAYNVTNAMNNTAGDQIFLGSHTLYPSNTANIAAEAPVFLCYFNEVNNLILQKESWSNSPSFINLFDLNGKLIFHREVILQPGILNEILLPNTLKSGMYIVSVESDSFNEKRKLFF